MSGVSWLRNIDQFRKIPAELTNPSMHGAYLTLLAYVAMGLLFVLEMYAYLKTDVINTVELDKQHDKTIFIDFDVVMYEVPCDHANVVVKDLVGNHELELLNVDISKEKLHAGTGQYKGAQDMRVDATHRKTPSEDHHAAQSEEEHPDLDADWVSTSDHFQHTDFDAVIRYHDFTFINFYATWCIHCRRFAPTWKEAEEEADSQTWKDKNGNQVSAKLLRVNCVEFSKMCLELGVRAYPTLRLYKRDATFSQYRGARTKSAVLSFFKEFINKEETSRSIKVGKASEIVSHHSHLHEGCRIQGGLEVRRVPGYFVIEADSELDTLDPKMTNVSHRVNHLYIVGNRNSLRNFVKTTSRLVYGDALANVQPMRNADFITTKEHSAPQHILDIIPTVFESGVTLYQSAVQSHMVDVPVTEVPQARFQYVFSPMAIAVTQRSRPFYDFVTSLFAIIGGTYTFISLVDRFLDTMSSKFKSHVGKLG